MAKDRGRSDRRGKGDGEGEGDRERGGVEAEVARLRKLVRARKLKPATLELCACLGHEPAQRALEAATPAGDFLPLDRWCAGLNLAFWQALIAVDAAAARRELAPALTQERRRPDARVEVEKAIKWAQQALVKLEGWAKSPQGAPPSWPERAEAWELSSRFQQPFALAAELERWERHRLRAYSPGWNEALPCLRRLCREPEHARQLGEVAVPLLLDAPYRPAPGPASEADYLRARVAAKTLRPAALRLAGISGHAAAAAVAGVEELPLRAWSKELAAGASSVPLLRAVTGVWTCVLPQALLAEDALPHEVEMAYLEMAFSPYLQLDRLPVEPQMTPYVEDLRDGLLSLQAQVRREARAFARLVGAQAALLSACLGGDPTEIRKHLLALVKLLDPERAVDAEASAKERVVEQALRHPPDRDALG
ncbi:MAG: hypothetical protein AB7N76_15750 [Planctomycetota bacterium]